MSDGTVPVIGQGAYGLYYMRMTAYDMVHAVAVEPVFKSFLRVVRFQAVLSTPMHAGYYAVGFEGPGFLQVLLYDGGVYVVDYAGRVYRYAVGIVRVVEQGYLTMFANGPF